MADLREIISFLDTELQTAEVKDFPGALNGLQLENSGQVDRICSAVDASLAVIEEAASVRNSLLIVHHGMFWQGAQKINGPYFSKLKTAIGNNLAIYSSHLPLDIHPVHGNNVLLAQSLGLVNIQPILVKKGFPTGVCGEWSGSLVEFCKIVEKSVEREIVVCSAGSENVSKVAVITGGAGSAISEVADLGADVFVTGEGSHWTFVESEERRMNTVYAGHYATEVFGVKSLSQAVAARFGLEVNFFNRTGGL